MRTLMKELREFFPVSTPQMNPRSHFVEVFIKLLFAVQVAGKSND